MADPVKAKVGMFVNVEGRVISLRHFVLAKEFSLI